MISLNKTKTNCVVDKRRYNKGTKGNKGGGRPSKSDEQLLLEKLGPMSDEAHRQLETAIKSGEQWAVKLWFEYFYGKPKQSMDVTSDGKAVIVPISGVNIIKDDTNEQTSAETD